MGFITKDRKQIELIGYSLSDFVEEKSKCRFIVKLVNGLNLRELYGRYSPQGGDALDPSVMLSIWFLGYSESVTSSRKLEELCKRDLHFIYTSANLRPDHTSLSRFRKDHLDLIPGYFVEIVRKAKQAGISDFKKIAIDGSKIKAASSKRKSKNEKLLDKYIMAVQKDIKEYIEQCESSDADEERRKNNKKIAELKEKEKELLSRRNELIERKKKLEKKDREYHQINITEPEAYLMNHGPGKTSEPSYNVQIGVDINTHLITGEDVVQDRSDFHQFGKQHKNNEENLGSDPQRKYVSDAGYYRLEEVKNIEEEGIFGIIADPNMVVKTTDGKELIDSLLESGRRIKKEDFKYNPVNDTYKCPMERELSLGERFKRNGIQGRIYVLVDCTRCSLGSQCFRRGSKRNKRHLTIDDREEYAIRMREKLRMPENRELMRQRAISVEPVFGNIKSNMGYSRFSLRGLEQVKGEFALMCIAHNINKLFSLFIAFFCNLFLTLERFTRGLLRKTAVRVNLKCC